MGTVLIQGNEKCLIKFAPVSEKTLKAMKWLPKILFNIDIMDLCLLPGPCILFISRFEVFLAKLKLSGPIEP